jgi:hypothetical protein
MMFTLALGYPEVSVASPGRGTAILWMIALQGAALVVLRKWSVLLAIVLMTPGLLAATFILGGLSTVVLLAAGDLDLALGLDALLVAGLWWWGRTRGRGVLLAVPASMLALHMVVAGTVVVPLFSPPDESVCASLTEQPGVSLLSTGLTEGFGAWVELLPGGRRLAATFKVHHDLLLSGDGDSGENRILFLSRGQNAKPVAPALKFPDIRFPERMSIDAEGRLVFTMLDGRGRHAVGVVDYPLSTAPQVDRLTEFPTAPMAHSFEPNRLHEHDGRYVVFGIEDEVRMLDPETLVVVDKWQRSNIDHLGGKFCLYLVSPSPDRVILSTLGFNLIDINLDTKQERTLTLPWPGAAGVLALIPEREILVLVDMLFHNLVLIDLDRFEILATHALDFGPRTVAWASGPELLFVGSYIDGDVHTYRLDDGSPSLREVGTPIQVGGTLRHLRLDEAPNYLYAASKCGLIGIDVARAFDAALHDTQGAFDPTPP